MKVTLLILAILSGSFGQNPIQSPPELPDYASSPYYNRNRDKDRNAVKGMFKPKCNKDWGPTPSESFDKDSTSDSSDVIVVFFNEDDSVKSAEWFVATKTEEKWNTVVRCYLYQDGKYVFKKELPIDN